MRNPSDMMDGWWAVLKAAEPRRRAWRQRIGLSVQGFKARLGEGGTGALWHGDTATVADICLASLVVVIRVVGIAVAGTPMIDAITARCEALDAFARADPMRQVGAPAG